MNGEDIILKAAEVEENLIEINIGKLGYITISRGLDSYTTIRVYKETPTKGCDTPIIKKIEELIIDDSQLI